MKTILLVDDDTVILRSIANMLAGKVKVIPVPSGTVALLSLSKVRPDVILLDVMMPEMDGYETAKKIAESGYSDIPIIFATGVEGEVEGRCIKKPYTESGIMDVINDL